MSCEILKYAFSWSFPMVETRCYPYESQFLVGIKLYLMHRIAVHLSVNFKWQWDDIVFFLSKNNHFLEPFIRSLRLINNYVNTLESKL